MSLILELINHESWLKFLEYKDNKTTSKKEIEYLKGFIINKKYLEIVNNIINGSYVFSIPVKHFISKRGSNKKRVVYTYQKDEVIIMKFITFLLYKYDYLFCDNCYAFRRNISPKKAILNMAKKNNLNKSFGYKLDISNYFGSIDNEKLLEKLEVINDDKLLGVFRNLLTNDRIIYNNKEIVENKGAIAGCSLSSFFANIYLNDLDHLFSKDNYARYADDIIIFNESKEELEEKIKVIKDYLKENNLSVNPKKEKYFSSQEKWEFLGFSYNNGVIDISSNTKRKIKAKIRRKARALLRWKHRKSVSDKSVVKVMNKIFNYKFFGGKEGNELNWCLWYFPVINTTKSLKEIDEYYQSYLRYLVVGNFKKNNKIKVKYKFLKECNYKSLVNEFYKSKKIDNKSE